MVKTNTKTNQSRSNKTSKPTNKSKTQPKKRVKQQVVKPMNSGSNGGHHDGNRSSNDHARTYKVKESSGGGLSLGKIRSSVRRVHADNDVHPGCDVHKAGNLSVPTLKYLSTLADPTLDESQMAPMPSAEEVPGPVSLLRYVSRGTFSCSPTSTSGLAFLSVHPGTCLGYNARNIASYTNTSFTGSVFDYTQTASQYDDVTLNSPYSTGQLTPAKYSARVVSCKVEVRNVTPQMGRGGVLYMIEPQAHDIEGIFGNGPSSLASNARVTEYNMGTDDVMSLLWHPTTDAGQSGFDAGSDPVDQAKAGMLFSAFRTDGGNRSESTCGELLVMAVAPSSVLTPGSLQVQQLEFVITTVYECAGTEVPGKSEFNRDSEGWSYCASAINEMKAKSGEINPPSTSPVQTVKSYVREAVSAAEEVIPVAQNLYSLLM